MLHISAGDCLREEMLKENSFYKNLIINNMNEGKIVPVQITCSLLKNKIFEANSVILLNLFYYLIIKVYNY